MRPFFPNVAIIGLGLIGGSIALELKRKHLAKKVVGVSRSRGNRREALRRKAVDEAFSRVGSFLSEADLVVLATPVNTVLSLLKEIRPFLKKEALVTDVGSVKAPIAGGGFKIFKSSFIGGHPIAGTEKSGMGAAQLGLFRGRKWILTPSAGTPRSSLTRLKGFVKALGAEVVEIDAQVHDRIFSAVSHLPNVLAYALANTVASLNDSKALRLAGGSLRDMTRLAESPPEMWRDISLANRDNVLRMIGRFEGELKKFRKALRKGGGKDLMRLFKNGREFKVKKIGGRQ